MSAMFQDHGVDDLRCGQIPKSDLGMVRIVQGVVADIPFHLAMTVILQLRLDAKKVGLALIVGGVGAGWGGGLS